MFLRFLAIAGAIVFLPAVLSAQPDLSFKDFRIGMTHDEVAKEVEYGPWRFTWDFDQERFDNREEGYPISVSRTSDSILACSGDDCEYFDGHLQLRFSKGRLSAIYTGSRTSAIDNPIALRSWIETLIPALTQKLGRAPQLRVKPASIDDHFIDRLPWNKRSIIAEWRLTTKEGIAAVVQIIVYKSDNSKYNLSDWCFAAIDMKAVTGLKPAPNTANVKPHF